MDIVVDLLKNSAVLGCLLTFVAKWIHGLLAKVDASGLELKYMPQLNTTYLILTGITAAVLAAKSGHLGTLDLTALMNLIQTWLPIMLSGKALQPIVEPKHGTSPTAAK